VELVDTQDLKSCGHCGRAGSIPAPGTPSDVFLWASLGAMAASLTLKILRRNDAALFVGHWAPSFLLFGIYNKLVKQLGHDSEDVVI
jgi:hypothetical protein